MTTKRDISRSEGLALSVCSNNTTDDFNESGLGERYLSKMNENRDTLHQVGNKNVVFSNE